MTLYDDLMRKVLDYRLKEKLIAEKKYFKEMQKEYGASKKVILGALSSFFSEYQRDGRLRQEELMKYNRINQLENVIAKNLIAVNAIETKTISHLLEEQIQDDFYFNAFVLASFGINKKISLTPEEMKNILDEEWAGEKYDKTLKRRKQETTGALKRELLLLTATNGAALNELNKTVEKKMDSTLKHGLLVYQNENTRKKVMSEMLASEKLGVTTKVRFLTSLDDKLCSICSQYDGREYEKGKQPTVPLHPRCRCTYLELIDNWQQTLRSARDRDTKETYLTDAKTFADWKANNYK